MNNIRVVKRIGVLLAGAGAGLYPVLSCALGLGEIQVESRLNQPLRARIEIVGLVDLDSAPIRARVAADVLPGDGATDTGLLHSLRVSVETDGGHRYFVVVTSAEALTEPLFDVPIEVSEQSLQVVRNYSVFLDPAPLEEGVRSPAAMVAAGSSPEPRAQSGAMLSQARPARSAGEAQGALARSAAETARAETSGGAARPQTARDVVGVQADANAGAAVAPTTYTVRRSDTLRRIARRLGARTSAERSRVMRWIFEHNPEAFRGGMRHLRVGAKLTLPESAGQKGHPALAGTPAAKESAVVAKSSTQGQLEGQLTTLQQMLSQMQQTISAQDAQIANLTRQIAATSQAQRAQSQQPPVQSVVSAAAVDDEGEPQVRPLWLRPNTYYGIAGVGAIGVVLAWIVARVRRAREVTTPRYPLTEHASETARLARTDGAGTAAPESAAADNQAMPESRSAAHGPLGTMSGGAGSVRPAVQPARGPAISPEPTLTQELPAADLESMLRLADAADYGGSQGTGARPLSSKRELVADTDVMPFVMKPENQVKPVAGRPAYEVGAQKLEMQPDGSVTNKEIIKLLEHSLESEPHRVDLQLKLLEMYHQEALGNLENFHSLLHKVGADRRGLSPAQISYVEMLQRTLEGGNTHSTSDPRTEAAV